MSIERRISLDTAITRQDHALADSNHQAPGRQPGDAERHAFEQAMARGDTPAPDDDAAPDAPFSLFAGALRAPAAPGAREHGLSELVATTVQRLLVEDFGSSSRRVHMDLDDDVLPGVGVTVFEEEGRLVADFVCSVERSRERLDAAADTLAAELADRLARSTRVRVSADDPEDPCVRQVDADPAVSGQEDIK